MDKSIKIFSTPLHLARSFADELVRMFKESADRKKPFNIALSGGSTPELLFSRLAGHLSKSVPWEFVHLFWGDERCVPPDNIENNYGMAKRILIDKIDIPSFNVHRIRGEEDPDKEATRYSSEIYGFTAIRDGLPLFDLVILGLGEDGHTASLFPGHLNLLTSDKICETAFHPVTHQRRITLTGRVINNAKAVGFLVTGKKKAEIVEGIIKKKPSALNFPASYIVPVFGSLSWFMDEEAGSLL